jgi:hypothetical protein
MATANLRVDEQTTQNLGRPALEVHIAKPDEGISPRPIPVSRVRRLDVDAVLARSLAKVVGE